MMKDFSVVDVETMVSLFKKLISSRSEYESFAEKQLSTLEKYHDLKPVNYDGLLQKLGL